LKWSKYQASFLMNSFDERDWVGTLGLPRGDALSVAFCGRMILKDQQCREHCHRRYWHPTKSVLVLVQDHMLCQITDPTSRASTDPRYLFYAFDCFANVNLRGQDTRLVLSCGFMKEERSQTLSPNRSD
jgi:hypothetical protein